MSCGHYGQRLSRSGLYSIFPSECYRDGNIGLPYFGEGFLVLNANTVNSSGPIGVKVIKVLLGKAFKVDLENLLFLFPFEMCSLSLCSDEMPTCSPLSITVVSDMLNCFCRLRSPFFRFSNKYCGAGLRKNCWGTLRAFALARVCQIIVLCRTTPVPS